MNLTLPLMYMLYNNSICGNNWDSAYWNNSIYRFYNKNIKDIFDTTNISQFNGDTTCNYTFAGNGEMNMVGKYPRVYLKNLYTNTEATMYYKKDTTAGKDADGIVFGARSAFNGHTENSKINNANWMNTHTYYGRIRHDGKYDICKEQIHNQEFSCYPKVKPYLYTDKRRLPTNQWLGMKFIVANICPHSVLLQLWADKTSNSNEEQLNNKTNWELLLEVIDTNGSFPSSINPLVDLYELDRNAPFLTSGMSLVRNGFVYEKSYYKYVSVREIELSETDKANYLIKKNNLNKTDDCCSFEEE